MSSTYAPIGGWNVAAAAVSSGVAQRGERAALETETEEGRLAALMIAAQEGDGQAYAALLRTCVPFIRATVRRQGVLADRAEDVVQDVLLALHRARHTYDPARPFTAWLRTIAQRRAIDSL